MGTSGRLPGVTDGRIVHRATLSSVTVPSPARAPSGPRRMCHDPGRLAASIYERGDEPERGAAGLRSRPFRGHNARWPAWLAAQAAIARRRAHRTNLCPSCHMILDVHLKPKLYKAPFRAGFQKLPPCWKEPIYRQADVASAEAAKWAEHARITRDSWKDPAVRAKRVEAIRRATP